MGTTDTEYKIVITSGSNKGGEGIRPSRSTLVDINLLVMFQ